VGERLSRRGLLTGAVAAAAGSVLALPNRRSEQRAKQSLRVAYITDVHLDTTNECLNGLVGCLKKVHSLDNRPDLVIQGGDLIWDALSRDEGSVARQFDLAREVFDKHCTIPIEHVLGNHDIWGWWNANSAGIRSDPKFGKSWWLAWAGYQNTYRTFDRGGWRFIVLDSIVEDKNRAYGARLDHAQFEWLKQVLAKTPSTMHVCVVSHVPILSIAAAFFGPSEQSGHWHVSRSLMHIDARKIKDLFRKHPNVKACLSGHIHMADRVEYNGVKYYGMGAVCGAWWKGPMQETPRQFGVVDFYSDGQVHATYLPC
jgi:3',5'-cyclic-AMP phosphodiesterase